MATSLSEHSQSLWNSCLFADLTLLLKNNEKLLVHKFIVCRCDFFKAACSGNFKEAKEGVIRFPEDPPAALRGLVMWLYGFPLSSCRAGLGLEVTQDFPQACIFLIDMFNLAEKYNLPLLKSTIEGTFTVQCSNYAISYGKSHPGFWYLPPLRLLLADPDRANPLHEILLASFRANAFRLPNLPDDIKSSFWAELQAWPELALHLLATGGLDGKACKIFPEIKVSTQMPPTPNHYPVVPATSVKKVTPVKVTPVTRYDPANTRTSTRLGYMYGPPSPVLD